MKKPGLISLVGSGPGDPGLLTLKAKQRLEEADFVVYDTLANPAHLAHAKKARVQCVGEGFRHHPVSQSKLYRAILAASRKGQRVVRLKGGDPCLFGRGGEEALLFAKQKLPFEIVPGVTSATAVAAYAGVPLTHRDHNASVTFITGHRAHDKRLDTLDWRALAALRGTLVVYMGFYNLGVIARHLQDAGLAPSTPALVVEWGTLPRQRSVSGPLYQIQSLARAQRLQAPCLIVIGEVVRLRKNLDWYRRLPLRGKKIVVTRPFRAEDRLSARLTELGAEVLHFPVIEIKAPDHWGPVDRAIRMLENFTWVVFASASGVRFFMKRLESLGRDSRSFGGAKIAAVGPETARALREYGLRADVLPAQFEARALLGALKAGDARDSALLVRTSLADQALDRRLQKKFSKVVRVNAYQTTLPKQVPGSIRRAILRGEASAAAFTSASTVDHFVRIIGKKKVAALAKSMDWYSIGPATTAALRRHGLRPKQEAQTHHLEGLVEAIAR